MFDIFELTDEQWQQLLDRLTYYALQKYRKLGWSQSGGYRSPCGMGPEDIATEAIERLIEGTRQYNKDKYPDILIYLKGVIDSIVSHIIESPEFEKKYPMPCILNSDGEIEEIEVDCKGPDSSQIHIQMEVVEKSKSTLCKHFAQDQVVLGILECIEAGIEKRSERAEYIGVKESDITNAQKRLQRQFDKIKVTL
jgi:hypothetical protein